MRLLRLVASPPDGRKIRVRISPDVPSERLGDCSQKGDHYLIRINKDVVEKSPDTIYLLLAHEWAHALAWESSGADHSSVWGLAVARCWRAIAGEINAEDLLNVAESLD